MRMCLSAKFYDYAHIVIRFLIMRKYYNHIFYDYAHILSLILPPFSANLYSNYILAETHSFRFISSEHMELRMKLGIPPYLFPNEKS